MTVIVPILFTPFWARVKVSMRSLTYNLELLTLATDKLSEGSTTELQKKVDSAQRGSRSGGGGGRLRSLLSQLPGSEGQQLSREMNEVEGMSRAGPGGGHKNPADMSPEELHATCVARQLWGETIANTTLQYLESAQVQRSCDEVHRDYY